MSFRVYFLLGVLFCDCFICEINYKFIADDISLHRESNGG